MHFLIVTYDEYINIPYIKKYEDVISQTGGTYDIVLWNRRNLDEVYPSNYFLFHATTKASKWSKIVPFFRWRKFVKNRIAQTRYDKLIVLTTMPAILIADILLFQYRERFLLDIRDYTYENFSLYRYMVNSLVSRSGLTTISSKGFWSFIIKNEKVFVTHNISNKEYETSACRLPQPECRPLIIGFVGGIRYYNENIRIIQQLKNNSNYLLQYVGKIHPGCDLQHYCAGNNISNVSFLPAYTNAQKPLIYQSIDIINAVYGSGSPEVMLALPNKLYDCIIFKKPIMVSADTYLASVVKKYKLGFAVDILKEDLNHCISAFLNTFNQEVFLEGCRTFLQTVQKEEKETNIQIHIFCREN